MDAKELYGKIIEYYHFLVFLILGLLALIGGFVYLQIKQSIFEQKYETELKIDKKIEDANISKKIDDKIDEEGLADKTIQSVMENSEYIRQLKEIVHESFDDDLTTIREDITAALNGIQREIDELKKGNG